MILPASGRECPLWEVGRDRMPGFYKYFTKFSIGSSGGTTDMITTTQINQSK
jgi:hypothetical protein